jgi:hypothetical protein
MGERAHGVYSRAVIQPLSPWDFSIDRQINGASVRETDQLALKQLGKYSKVVAEQELFCQGRILEIQVF